MTNFTWLEECAKCCKALFALRLLPTEERKKLLWDKDCAECTIKKRFAENG